MRGRKLFLSFLKDELSFIVTYFLSIAIVMLFYSIEVKHQVEILYPLMLSLFLLLVHEGVQYYRYVQRNKELDRMLHSPGYEVHTSNAFVAHLNKNINELHHTYLGTIHELSVKQRENQRFSSVWIHNMKTPVAVSNLVLQRLEKNEITLEEATTTLVEENQKLLTSLNNVLELQRFEEAVNDYQPTLIPLMEQLKELINSNRSLFIQNHVYPKFVSEEEAKILVDRKWNQVMLQQFITNAVKYSHYEGEESDEKYVTFQIRCVEEQGKAYVELTIQDEGIGIPAYDLPKVMEAFFTGDNGRKQYNSSGIGLYLCDQIAKLMRAQLQIESQVKQGTTIRIRYLTKL